MEFLTVAEVAKRLRVHTATVKRWLREGEMGGVLLGDRAGWRISEEDLARFLEARRQAQRAELEGKAAA